MADVKISALTPTTSGTVGDYVPIVQDGVTKKIQLGTGGGFDAGKLAGMLPGTNLNADTVSGYGIGVTGLPAMTGSADNYQTAGLYSCGSSGSGITHAPFVSNSSMILVMPLSSSYIAQIAMAANTTDEPYLRIRIKYSNTWSASWREVWTSFSDGNGGQPPAPKPLVSSTTFSTGGTAYTMPSGGGFYKFTMYVANNSAYFVTADVWVSSGNQVYLFNKIVSNAGALDMAPGTGLVVTGSHNLGVSASFVYVLSRYSN